MHPFQIVWDRIVNGEYFVSAEFGVIDPARIELVKKHG